MSELIFFAAAISASPPALSPLNCLTLPRLYSVAAELGSSLTAWS